MVEIPGNIIIRDLGLAPYEAVWQLQQALQQQRIQGVIADTLLVCEHPPVVTLGRSANRSNVLLDQDTLLEQGISLFDVERGGDVTFHNPGQLVVYPIIDLKNHKKDVGWYMRSLEQVVLATLHRIGIRGRRIQGKTGVWIDDSNSSLSEQKERKIASIGVRISRWVTMHGFALNVCNDLAGFQIINPCGFTGIEITSVYKELQQFQKLSSTASDFPTIINVKYNLLEEISQIFNYQERINHAESNVNCSWIQSPSGTIP